VPAKAAAHFSRSSPAATTTLITLTTKPASPARRDFHSQMVAATTLDWRLGRGSRGLSDGLIDQYVHLMSVIILNMGRYIAMMMTPTIAPTAIIISGSMIEVMDWMALSTSSS
jgi:hypothetical protein